MPTLSRKPLYVLGGAITGMLATYVLTKPTLRDKLKNAKTMDDAFDAVGKQMSDDAQEITEALRSPPRGSLLARMKTSFNRGARAPMMQRWMRTAGKLTEAVGAAAGTEDKE